MKKLFPIYSILILGIVIFLVGCAEKSSNKTPVVFDQGLYEYFLRSEARDILEREGLYDQTDNKVVGVCRVEHIIFSKIPNKNETYYSISSIGEIEKSTWKEDDGDLYRLKTNNVFLKQEDAEKQAEKNFNIWTFE